MGPGDSDLSDFPDGHLIEASSRAILFDADGVLVDSHAGYRNVWGRWSRLRGLDPAVVLKATHARRPLDTIAEVAPQLDAVAEYELLVGLVNELPDSFPLFPDAPAFLEELPPTSWAIVTSGNADRVRSRLQAGRAHQPSVLVDGASVVHGKPHPEAYLLAARRLGVGPEHCVVVEDAPAGVEAGLAAGMTVLALATSHSVADLGHAHLIVPSIATARPVLRSWMRSGRLDTPS
ncbi:HAD-IA family hydrolase [Nocardioides gilvus]|uniref:HAD-IA family hydrolase n=1 Tax=Nocardioides gilvus TaxID=1735589 RepID=UPI000D749C98|nr:HAD-IA family hydrolase [Nocardioides gilvus]